MWNNSAFNHNQTFLPGGGLQAEIECGLLSPLHATCHCSSGSGHDPGPLLRHRPFGAAAQMCDMVTFKSSSDSDSLSLYTCMQVGACVPLCVCPCMRACARACASSSSLCCLPLVGHDIVTKACSLGKQKNIDVDESNLFLHLR